MRGGRSSRSGGGERDAPHGAAPPACGRDDADVARRDVRPEKRRLPALNVAMGDAGDGPFARFVGEDPARLVRVRGPLASCLLALAAACGSPSSVPLPAGSTSAPPPVPPAAPSSTAPREPLSVSTWPPRTPTGAAPETLELAIADLHVDPRAAVSRDRFDTGSLPLDERVLEVSDEVFRAHWGVMHTTVEVRRADLPERRRALLFLPREGDPARLAPFLVIADAQHRVLWQKARPLAGIEGRWRHLTVTAGPSGSVVVFGWDEASGAITARQLRHDGHLVGDRRVFDVTDCAGLDAVWWPGRGWIVTTVSAGAARTALLGEDGRRRDPGPRSRTGGARPRRAAPSSPRPRRPW